MQRKHRKRRGFSLIEALTAVFIMSTGLVAAFYLTGLGTAVNSDAKITNMAYQAAQQEIEVLRNMPFATLQGITRSTSPESRFLKPDGTDDASRPADAGYANVLTPALAGLPGGGTGGLIITNDSTSGSTLKHITVVVRWTDRNNVARTVAMSTLLAQGGIDAQ